jgi:hypothetical protein
MKEEKLLLVTCFAEFCAAGGAFGNGLPMIINARKFRP